MKSHLSIAYVNKSKKKDYVIIGELWAERSRRIKEKKSPAETREVYKTKK